MKRGRLINGTGVLMLLGMAAVAAVAWMASAVQAQQPTTAPATTFKSSVDLVRLAAVVRDRKGRFVRDLTVRDFEVLDAGEPRRITDFHHELSGVGVALLFDASGSMEGQLSNAREAAEHVLSWLDNGDEVGIFTFDTNLDEVTPFTPGLKLLPREMAAVVPFGATSLHDAIAQTASRVAEREGRRRAVVVFTDGNDNSSHLTPPEVAAIASAIDVPIYLFGIVPSIDNPTSETATPSVERSALAGPLSDLAAWTGGGVFVASTPGQRSLAARQIVDELRHQYLIAFEASSRPGWHPLVVRAARQKDLVIRTRSGYMAGQGHPSF